jgi:acetyltransferase-like isoleucine patch superfamily enzyme
MDPNALFKRINVRAGAGCEVSPFSSLENVVLGDGVRISEGVQLKNVIVGNETKLGRQVTFYSTDPDRPVRLGSHCWFSHGVFGEGTGGEIVAEDYVVLAHYTLLLTSSGPGEQSVLMSRYYPTQVGSVLIGRHSWVGAHCIILPGVRLADAVVIGANSVVHPGDYGVGAVYGGTPAKFLKQLARDERWPPDLDEGAGRR